MTVYFIGAGPGDPDLITVKGLRLIERCKLCLYAGSLVPEATIKAAPKDAVVIDTAALHLDQIMDHITAATAKGIDVARVHSGDPSIYGAIGEQMRRLSALDIPFEIIPGVPAFAAAAAALKLELTLPKLAQSIVITRTSMKSTDMPEKETLANFAATGASLLIHLSVRNLRFVERELIPFYGDSCPAIIAYRVGWPDQFFIRTTLDQLYEQARAAKITRTALIMVGPALDPDAYYPDSALYDEAHPHILRPKNIAG
ncbi:MAG: precorrin-4 C(11)-methyltransferase [Alphaproteobacteria bacterium]